MPQITTNRSCFVSGMSVLDTGNPSLSPISTACYIHGRQLYMSDRPICKSADHLFVPIVEVSIPLLRCIHCNVFAYHDTVKQLAKNRRYQSDVIEQHAAKPVANSYWRRLWTSLRR